MQCKKHSSISMHISTAKVTDQNIGHKIIPKMIWPARLSNICCYLKIRLKNVTASSVWARERAHSLRYDAVFDTQPRTNSIVSIMEWMKSSPKEPPCDSSLPISLIIYSIFLRLFWVYFIIISLEFLSSDCSCWLMLCPTGPSSPWGIGANSIWFASWI